MDRLNPGAFDTFRFTHRVLDGRRIRLGYALEGASCASVALEETFDIPESLGALASIDDPACAGALLGLHLAAGTSYWKTSLPRTIVLEAARLSDDEAQFWTDVYTLGLGEFFYRNGIDPRGRVAFGGGGAGVEIARARPAATALPLLLWGGGKDSVVSHEVLAGAGVSHELLSVGRSEWEWIDRSAAFAAAPLHVVERGLDLELFAMNAAGAWNGHVPVSAILAAAATVVAALTGRPAVIASNEASASYGNVSWHGLEINHQWSKSLDFETGFSRWLARRVGRVEYYSLLRPLTELRIVKAFCAHPGYFEAVTSCNTNFRQRDPAHRRFCLRCAKCVFVSLMARPWLDDRAFHRLFGGDALNDPANLDLVEELLGIRGAKPFECVGTPDETAAAIYETRRRGRLLPHGVMTAFAESETAKSSNIDALVAEALARSSRHRLAPAPLAMLDAYLDRH